MQRAYIVTMRRLRSTTVAVEKTICTTYYESRTAALVNQHVMHICYIVICRLLYNIFNITT